jgi:very-short-patch-repair endonuclease
MPTSARTERARRLRRDSADAERKLWSILRGRKLDGFKFRRQVPIDRYFADFACVAAKLVVELDGGQHAERIERDLDRTRTLEACGWRVIRFWNHAVLAEREGVAATILAALRP